MTALPVKTKKCNCCGSETPVLEYFPGKGIYCYCKSCRLYFFNRDGGVPDSISEKYFDDEYREQYGKTYLEDFDHIREMGRSRITQIQSLESRKSSSRESDQKKKILDIGCAYGPFLSVAKEKGFIPFGQDLFPPAVEWVNGNLKIPALQGDFLSEGFPPAKGSDWPLLFDVISLWYVIEHFENPREVLTKINRMMEIGGILAFSTPSAEGISARKNFSLFLEKSPSDHYSVWKPSTTKSFLKQLGFRVEKIVITGHHPERIFPSLQKDHKKGNRKSIEYRFGLLLSRIFRWGDTFEVYARKVENI